MAAGLGQPEVHAREEEQPQAKTFAMGWSSSAPIMREDNWFLQIETFDPHEPFFTQQKYKDLYPHEYDGRHFDWPPLPPGGRDARAGAARAL